MPAKYPYPADHCAALRLSLSDERFARYLAEANGDEAEALALYTWNTALSAAFYGPLQACEVALRNSAHLLVSNRYGATWFNNVGVMRQDELRMASEAADTIERAGKVASPGRVVAQLGFGFWTGLFANYYDDSLWRYALHAGFKPRIRRRELFDELDRLRTLRNRIAHHEPIFHRLLLDDYGRIRDILTRLSPDVLAWVDHHSRVYDVIASREDTDRF